MSAEAGLQRHVELLHEHSTHVVADPFFEHIHQKLTVLDGVDRTPCRQVAALRIQRPRPFRWQALVLVVRRHHSSADALDDRNELYPARVEFIAQKTVDGAAVLLVGSVNGAKDVEFDAMPAQGEA